MALKQRKVILGKRVTAIVVVVCICTLALGVTMFFNAKNTADMRSLLVESIEEKEVSTLHAASRMIDRKQFVQYTSLEATDTLAYWETLSNLRALAWDVNARYIYALRIIDGQAQFIFDTDSETDTRFTPYELYGVHEAAFAGKEAMGTRNVQDEWGNHNSGAIPLFHEGQVVGILSVDFDDAMLVQSDNDSFLNGLLLMISLLVTLLVLILISFSIRRLWVMNDETTHRSIHDPVTGLPNRRYLMDYMQACITAKEHFAVIFIDLDHFKQVNDRFGHDAGDTLLKSIAEYFGEVLYETASFRVGNEARRPFAARIGGDEFVQVVSGVDSEESAKVVATKLLEGFAAIDNPHIEPCQVGLSIGVALSPIHATDIHKLLKCADSAMYEAKNNGRNQFKIYARGMHGKQQEG